MNTTLLNAMTAALLTAACLTAFADPPKKHNRISTVSETSSYQSSTSAAEHEVAADSAGTYPGSRKKWFALDASQSTCSSRAVR